MLSFVIVGGGPTGVEVAAEMYDMITQDMARLYPQLTDYVKIRVIELMDHVLSTYDRKIGDYTGRLFQRNGIELVRSRSTALRVADLRALEIRALLCFPLLRCFALTTGVFIISRISLVMHAVIKPGLAACWQRLCKHVGAAVEAARSRADPQLARVKRGGWQRDHYRQERQ